MTTTENNVEDSNNGFGYGQLEQGQFQEASNNKEYRCGCFSNLSLCRSYVGLGKDEIWKKVKEANIRKYANEHRISIFILFILILFCFFILLHLCLQVGAGIKTQNINGIISGNCTIKSPCKVGKGICTSDNVCENNLKCGDKNCKRKEGSSPEEKYNCCFTPKEPSNVTSSSIYDNDYERYGPQNVIAGSFYSFLGPYFKSKRDDFPWIQWKLPRTVNITGVTLVSRDCPSKLSSDDCPVLESIEVRAGKSFIDDNFSGIITNNKICGNFKGPGERGGVYTIKCNEVISSNVITVQLKDDNSILQISSINIEKDAKGTLCNGGSSCCTPGIPCGEGEGDCNTNIDCKEGLVCGHNNCPNKSGKNWDLADDCCYKPPKAKGSAIASSVFKDQRNRFGPRFAVDGEWSTRSYNIYTSKVEKLPWLQWNLPNRTKVFGVSISNEYGISQFNNNTHKNDLVNFEVRVGLRSVSELSDFSPGIHKGKIAINELCGTIEIRGGEDRVYPIICSKSILADYITIQMIDDNAMLQINELEVIKDADSSNIGCSCHDFINPNGYGQCKKGSSYAHVKGQKVCYVNQPSNCSDLTYSSTNEGKKFSAQACVELLDQEKNIKYNGTYDCKRQGCWLRAPYELDKDYGFFSKTNSNCTTCQDTCSKDPNCGAVECGGDKDYSTCAWWKISKCTDKKSPGFFPYSPNEYHYGYTCYKDNKCPWLTLTDEVNVLECGDGTHCNGQIDGWGCCNDHGKRSKCPPNYPIMCTIKKCGGGDHCCEKQCTPRSCDTESSNPSG